MLVAFVVYAAFAAFVHELIVGISAMHAGWFPAFAAALITLIVSILLGFPPVALTLLVGFSASTGPAFADMGYDLKAGFILRGSGADRAFELDGRRQLFYAGMLAFLIAIPTVYFAHPGYFACDLVPPVHQLLTERGFRQSSRDASTIVQEEQHEELARADSAIRGPAPAQHPVRFGHASRDVPFGAPDRCYPVGQRPVGGRQRCSGRG
jgi:hypothetical protein